MGCYSSHHGALIAGTSSFSTNLVRMLSRQAITRATQARNCLVVSSRGLSVSTPNPERDLVNFPARVRPIDKPPVRLGIFPEEWFTALYPKTGVTGPYMALVGVGTFLASKEYFVMEHDFYVGLGLAVVLTGVVKSAGPDLLQLSTKSWTKKKLLSGASGKMRLMPSRLQLQLRRLARPTPLHGKILLLPRRKLLDSSWRLCIGLGSRMLTPRLRKGWTTNLRLPML